MTVDKRSLSRPFFPLPESVENDQKIYLAKPELGGILTIEQPNQPSLSETRNLRVMKFVQAKGMSGVVEQEKPSIVFRG